MISWISSEMPGAKKGRSVDLYEFLDTFINQMKYTVCDGQQVKNKDKILEFY